MSIKTTYHRDGTVTYWSVHNQVWVKRAGSVQDRELAAMSASERERVRRHLQPAGGSVEDLVEDGLLAND